MADSSEVGEGWFGCLFALFVWAGVTWALISGLLALDAYRVEQECLAIRVRVIELERGPGR